MIPHQSTNPRIHQSNPLWPSGGIYLQFTQEALLPAIVTTLKDYERWSA
jgi:hypothetical protein